MKEVKDKWPCTIEEKDDFGWTPLHIAAHLGNEKLVKLLLEKGNSPAYVRNKEGHSTLHIAAKEGNVEVMKELITACPDIYEMLDNRGRTALHLAAESGEEAVVEFFLKRPSEKRAFAFLPKIAKFFKGWIIVEFFKRKAKYFKYVKEKVDSSWIIVEFFKRKANCFKYVKEKVDSTHNGTKSNERGEENAKFIQELYKGLINEQDEEGNTPMHLAAIEGHYNLAFQLKDGASLLRFNVLFYIVYWKYLWIFGSLTKSIGYLVI